MKVIGHFVNGREVASASERVADIFNPATGEVQNKVSLGLASELDDAVNIAMKAQPEWAATNPQRRARVVMKFIDLLHRAVSYTHLTLPTILLV